MSVLTEDNTIEISLVIPFLNEEGSLKILYEKIANVLAPMGKAYEVIFIDDGSTDRSFAVVDEIRKSDSRVRLIRFPANRGKSAALNKGFEAARGKIVFTLDADLQDDPEEIPNFLNKMSEGYDLVSGWKKKRYDPLEKRLPSKLFNKVTALATGLKLHDFNCGFKAYRREILDEIKVYGDLHRYIPPLAHWLGYRVGEIAVKHHPREYGKSKYGWERYFRGFFDLFTVVMLTKYIRHPIYFFGGLGLLVLVFGLAILTGLTFLQLTYGTTMGHRPLTYLAVLSILFGSQSLSFGLISEMLTNISQKRGHSRISIRNRHIHGSGEGKPQISVIVPVHNERDNLLELFDLLEANLLRSSRTYEIVFVDDGSDDGSDRLLKELHDKDTRVQVIQLRKRFGKAAALQAGFDHSRGEVIVTVDGDLQDRPEEIGRFLEKIDGGCDLVVGRRIHVPAVRSFISKLFNRAVSLWAGHSIHDINCGYKAFKRRVIEDVKLHGEFQRFFPILVMRKGVRTEEIALVHHERVRGSSKYGFSRIPKAFLDLFAVVLLAGYGNRPLHLFGTVGLLTGLVGVAISGSLTMLKLFTGTIGGHNTLLLVGVMFIILGLQWFTTGILGELINNYFKESN